jgi:hypothetical protein
MRSSNEMYERGVRDAEQDDLNLFYYQHYYHYRRGYDRARRRLRQGGAGFFSPLRLLTVAAALVVIVLALNMSGVQLPDAPNPVADGAESSPTSNPSPTATARPTITPRPSSTPTPEPALRVGGRAAIVNVGDVPLRARVGPGIGQPVQVAFPQGAEVTIVEGPVEADGYVWWRIENELGTGWSAEANPEPGGPVWLQPLP